MAAIVSFNPTTASSSFEPYTTTSSLRRRNSQKEPEAKAPLADRASDVIKKLTEKLYPQNNVSLADRASIIEESESELENDVSLADRASLIIEELQNSKSEIGLFFIPPSPSAVYSKEELQAIVDEDYKKRVPRKELNATGILCQAYRIARSSLPELKLLGRDVCSNAIICLFATIVCALTTSCIDLNNLPKELQTTWEKYRTTWEKNPTEEDKDSQIFIPAFFDVMKDFLWPYGITGLTIAVAFDTVNAALKLYFLN